MTEKALHYLSGFGNEHATEALPGTLPAGQNAPQRPPRGLYTEQISGTPFTAPRAANRRSWLYRMRPSAMQRPFARIDNSRWRAAPVVEAQATPNRLRWDALPMEAAPADFIAGMPTIGGGVGEWGRAGATGAQLPWHLGGRAGRSFAAGRGRLGCHTHALQLCPGELHGAQPRELRPGGPSDFHRAPQPDGNAGHRQCRF